MKEVLLLGKTCLSRSIIVTIVEPVGKNKGNQVKGCEPDLE